MRADALHPGYGFLSENALFALKVLENGIRFVGPSPRWIDAMGHKTRARELAAQQGWPIGRGSGVLDGKRETVLEAARAIGYPVLVKPAAGGGGIGMLPARNDEDLLAAVERAASMAERGFGNREVYLERLVETPRHVEIQVLGDQHGAVAHLFERDCSVQRRHQKIIEEARAPRVAPAVIDPLLAKVAATLGTLGYDNLGTVEMLLAPDGEFRFLEMNTRLQVEHGVTEEITGVDLVVAQLRCAAGERLAAVLPRDLRVEGHAIQARVYAEDPKRFLPSPGTLAEFAPPTASDIRIETGYAAGRDRHATLRSLARQGDRARGYARGGDRQADRGAARIPHRRGQAQHPGAAGDPGFARVPGRHRAHGPGGDGGRAHETELSKETALAQIGIKAEVTGSVWKIVTEVGQTLGAGDTIMILESMKMEIPVMTEDGGKLVEIKVQEGVPVAEGQVVAVIEAQ